MDKLVQVRAEKRCGHRMREREATSGREMMKGFSAIGFCCRLAKKINGNIRIQIYFDKL